MTAPVTGPDAVAMLIDTIGPQAMHRVSRRLWESVRAHPPGASCDCPTAEAVAALVEEGFVPTVDEEREERIALVLERIGVVHPRHAAVAVLRALGPRA